MNPTSNTPERWLPVPGYEGAYEVSDHGRVRSLPRKVTGRNGREFPVKARILKPKRGRWGHGYVKLSKENVGATIAVHRLVIENFIGPAPEGMECCHNDSDATNNHVSNLRWDSHRSNSMDCINAGNHAMSNRTHCPRGHKYTVGNTYIEPSGSRQCRECKRQSVRNWRAKKSQSRILNPNGDTNDC